jgi:hypothetical protein
LVAAKIKDEFQYLIPESFGSQLQSSCLECGTMITIVADAVTTNGTVVFMCDLCYHNNSWYEFKLNATFATNHPCPICTEIIDFGSNFCNYCAAPYSAEDWNEYAAYVIGIGEYSDLNFSDGWDLLEYRICNKSISYRKKLDQEYEVLRSLCFLCLQDVTQCECAYNLTMYRLNAMAINKMIGVYYRIDYGDPGEYKKSELTCVDCKWQYTAQCKPLSLELLNVDADRYKRDRQIVIENELVTCEYMEKSDDWDYDTGSYFF